MPNPRIKSTTREKVLLILSAGWWMEFRFKLLLLLSQLLRTPEQCVFWSYVQLPSLPALSSLIMGCFLFGINAQARVMVSDSVMKVLIICMIVDLLSCRLLQLGLTTKYTAKKKSTSIQGMWRNRKRIFPPAWPPTEESSMISDETF